MRSAVALAVALAMLGGCTKNRGIAATLVGSAMTLGGVAIVRADPGCPENQWFCIATDTQVGGGALALAGMGLLIAGAVVWATSPDEPEKPPPPTGPPPPMLVDPSKRDTDRDRLAVQASLAARRGDCPGTTVSMKRLAELDGALWERLRLHDPPIAWCLL